MRCLMVALLLALAPLSSAHAQGAAVLLEDFEQGVARWTTNDHVADQSGGKATHVSIRSTRPGAPGVAGDRAAAITFQPAEVGWASVTLPVDGKVWQQQKCDRLTLWVRAGPVLGTVEVSLRAVYDNPLTGKRDLDVKYTRSLRVLSGWRLVVLELKSFKTSAGKALGASDLPHVEKLQFVQTGRILPFSFEVDDIVAESPGYSPERPPPEPAEGAIEVDFNKLALPALVQIGAGLPGPALPPDMPRAQQLAPFVLRLKLSAFYDDQERPIDWSRLEALLKWIAARGGRPLICCDRPPTWAADLFAFSRLCAQVATRCAERGARPYYEVFDAPLLSERYANVRDATDAYNIVAASIVRANKSAEVGGIGFSSAWQDNVEYFLRHATVLKFLSLHLYGAHSASVSELRLARAALSGASVDLPGQLTLREVRERTRKLRSDAPQLFVTELALNSVRDENGRAVDERMQAPYGAAWLAALAGTVAPYADKLLIRQLYGGGWGLADDDGALLPPFWAAWLFRTYCPRGARFAKISESAEGVVVYAARTRTAANVLIVSLADQPQAVTIRAKNVGSLSQVRSRGLSGRADEVEHRDLPRRSTQTVNLDGPEVVVVQFIPTR
ncbi:MAG: hypothetical protein ACE5R4_10995 [Armatimonadota bacterium]